MGKLLVVLVLLVVVGGAAYFLMGEQGSSSGARSEGEPAVRVEEKYGVTSGGVSP